jgi:hypothetical protein
MRSPAITVNKGIFVLLLLLLGSAAVAMAFSADDSTSGRYIHKPDSFFVVRASLNNEVDYFEVTGPGFRYDIRPNVRVAQKFGLAYRFLSFSYSFYTPVFRENDDNSIKGNTKAFSAGISIFGKHLGQTFQLSKTKGYYLENTAEFIPGWNEDKDPYIQLPDQLVYKISGATSYKFNPRLSQKAYNTQTEIQLKSAGSFLVTLNYNLLTVDNRSNDPQQQSSQRSVQAGTQLSAGYTHTFVAAKRWYATIGLNVGGGLNYTDLLTRFRDYSVSNYYTDPVFRADALLGLGYNSARFFFGVQATGTSTSEEQNGSGVVISDNRTFGQVFLGYRFNTPSFLKKVVNKMEELSPVKIR